MKLPKSEIKLAIENAAAYLDTMDGFSGLTEKQIKIHQLTAKVLELKKKEITELVNKTVLEILAK